MALTTAAGLPTLYEHYAGGGISSGLSADQPNFTLNDKNITIYSGAMHYFRIPRKYWRDRLRKLRAAGLNTVETYVPWNLHEPIPDKFDFGNGTSEWTSFLHLEEYLRIAQEEDLFAIVRPGPYICAEWEFGGFPSWLLQTINKDLKLRSSEPQYMNFVSRYFSVLLPILAALQFTKGGPIIAFQVENEYASSPDIDAVYIRQLYDIMKEAGLVELLVTSDGAPNGQAGTIPGLLLQTVNFGSDPNGNLNALKQMQPDRPFMAMEYWTGWFDHWTEEHHTVDNATFRSIYESILTYPASVNMYMFHGGTNFGFMNGANVGNGENLYFEPVTSSYDYDAPLSEAGDYTDKYWIVKELMAKYNTVKTQTPEPPREIPRTSYPALPIKARASIEDTLSETYYAFMSGDDLTSMEMLYPVDHGAGQRFGYISYQVYGLSLPAGAILTITGYICDTVMVLVDDELVSPPLTSSDDLNNAGFWRLENSNFTLTKTDRVNVTLTILVENFGRGNFGPIYRQTKGLNPENKVLINGEPLVKRDWITLPLTFDFDYNLRFDNWGDVEDILAPALYKTTLTLEEEPTQDTYIDMSDWTKGIVIVNGFVLGRYALIGPQQSLYLPAPFLHQGDNDILVFEHFQSASEIRFSEDPVFFVH